MTETRSAPIIGVANSKPSRRSVCRAALGTAAALWAPSCVSVADADPVAHTAAGRVRGAHDGLIKVFKGIPYGADTATTRFRPPAPPAPWSDVRDATRYGLRAPQPPRGDREAREGVNLLTSWAIPQESGEDCLRLNIWTPGLRDGGKRPVMVWLHGGGFSSGSGVANAYDGRRLAERGDVVVVTVNHRLNIFGYLYLGALDARYADSGNAGQHDQIAALAWVRDNIAEFGGDPDNVLIFGESGGGSKVCALMAMPAARGLFHRAVVQSGPMIWGAPAGAATTAARDALEVMGVSPSNLSRLDDLRTEEIRAGLAGMTPANALKLGPVVDGRGLPRDPFAPDAPAVSADVPLLIGYNRTETTFVLSGDPTNFTLSWDELPARLAPSLGELDVARVIADYRALMPAASPSDVFFDVTTQTMMTRNVRLITNRKAAQAGAPVYLYQLNWETPVDRGKWRSPHTLEIPLVFDNVAKTPSTYGAGAEDAQRVADQMSEAWIAFARNGDPNTPALPDWPAYDPTRRPAMAFDLESRVEDGLMERQMDILAGAPYWNMLS